MADVSCDSPSGRICLALRGKNGRIASQFPFLQTKSNNDNRRFAHNHAYAVEEVMTAKRSRVLLGAADAASLAPREQLLSKGGYDIVSARDGTEALKAQQDSAPLRRRTADHHFAADQH